jgi:enoyl-CoA hydratase
VTYSYIQFNNDDGIATVTISRPEALNALNSGTLEELSNVYDLIAGDEEIRVLILTGSGEKAFIAGADISELTTFNPLQARAFSRKGQAIIGKMQDLAIPVIAMVNGYCLGGGCEMALACDFIYASEKATFGLPEINLGIIPGFGGTQRLARLIGPNAAREMVLTGKYITAQEAYRIGLVSQVFALSELAAEVEKTAKVLAAKGKTALRAAKQAIGQGLNTDLATGLAVESDAFALCLSSPDAKEGTGAFLEKRKPRFAGKLNG